MVQPLATSSAWRPVAAASDHALASLVRRPVGQGVRLVVEQGPRDRVGAERFRLFLESEELGRTALPLDDGREVDVPDGILLQVIEALAELVPAGGSLVVEYDSPALVMTAQALAAGVPPVATPLGGMLFAAGCASPVRDCGTAAGGRAGRRRLEGIRASNEVTEHRSGVEMLEQLETFMARAKELDWQVQSQTRPIAEATITALRARLAVPEGPLPPA